MTRNDPEWNLFISFIGVEVLSWNITARTFFITSYLVMYDPAVILESEIKTVISVAEKTALFCSKQRIYKLSLLDKSQPKLFVFFKYFWNFDKNALFFNYYFVHKTIHSWKNWLLNWPYQYPRRFLLLIESSRSKPTFKRWISITFCCLSKL